MRPDVLFATGIALIALSLLAMGLRLISATTGFGILALSQLAMSLIGFITGSTVGASINAGCAAFFAWQWWRGGGGGGTRRRLRRVMERFQGVRRTAPVAGS